MTIREKGYPLGAMYAPFCRTLYVGAEHWEQDVRTMHEMGYTCLHGFVEWWRVEKENGAFDFSETDLLVELCAKYDITPIINVATQNGVGYYMPRWMQREYTGRGVVDNEGHGNEVKSEYRVACMDDPWYQAYASRYLQAVARHYANDSRVGGWVIWGEPMLHKQGKPICYCEHTVARFRSWLERKYGKIEELNEIWGHEGPSQYDDFLQIDPPVGAMAQRGSYASWTDWQTFMEENFAEHIRHADQIFKRCGAKQPTIVELMCYVGGSGLCNDLWELSKCADIVGVSNFSRPGIETELSMTVANSLAQPQKKSVFVVEANGGPRYPNYDKRTPGPEEIYAEAVQMAGENAKGLMYWCYRPRLSDYEGGAYGMCRADGKPLPRAYAGGKIGGLLERESKIWKEANWQADVAILYSNKIAHIAPPDMLSEVFADAQQGAMRLLLDAHITPQLIDEKWIQAGNLAQFKALILPLSYAMDESTARKIAEFAEAGGCVISDQGLAQKRLNGVCYQTLPGAKLDQLFGLEKEDILYIDSEEQLPGGAPALPVGTCLDILTPTKAQVCRTIGDLPLVTRCAAGRGCCWYIAYQAFADYRRKQGSLTLRQIVVDMLEQSGVHPFARMPELDRMPTPPVRISRLDCGTGSIYTVVNPGYAARTVNLEILEPGTLQPLLNTSMPECRKDGAGVALELSLPAWGTATFFRKA